VAHELALSIVLFICLLGIFANIGLWFWLRQQNRELESAADRFGRLDRINTNLFAEHNRRINSLDNRVNGILAHPKVPGPGPYDIEACAKKVVR
jgi:hypothetical protein